MAFLLADSFDHYATSDLLRKWTQCYGGLTATYAIVAGAGRRGTAALRIENVNGAYQALSRLVTPGTTTALVGTAFRASGTAAGWGTLITPASGGNSLNLVPANAGALDVRVNVLAAVRNSYYTHVAASINTNGTISLYRGNADSLGGAGLTGQDRIAATLGTTAQALLYDTTHFIELEVVVHPTSGSARVVVDGTEWLAVSGVRTQASGASSATAWQELAIGGHQAPNIVPQYWYFDDLYLGDTDLTDAFNQLGALAGDVNVDYANVFLDGATLDWTPLTGVTHFPMVDDNPPDLDATYNATTTLNAIDTFQKSAVPIVGATVIALQPIYLRRRTLGGNTATAAVIRDAGVNYSGSKEGSTTSEGDPSTYAYNWWTVTQRPSASGTALTQALVDAMEVGYKKVG